MLREAQRNIYFNLALVWEEGMEWNGMERNEENNFRIFFPSLVWEFYWRAFHSLV